MPFFVAILVEMHCPNDWGLFSVITSIALMYTNTFSSRFLSVKNPVGCSLTACPEFRLDIIKFFQVENSIICFIIILESIVISQVEEFNLVFFRLDRSFDNRVIHPTAYLMDSVVFKVRDLSWSVEVLILTESKLLIIISSPSKESSISGDCNSMVIFHFEVFNGHIFFVIFYRLELFRDRNAIPLSKETIIALSCRPKLCFTFNLDKKEDCLLTVFTF
mmetsp:Transcript_38835/g.38395  ORF Transcript_38835/g.38395 Transcript_38835/m.38395 type:complete len:219 (-) Transcript_38835:898-1554(-)